MYLETFIEKFPDLVAEMKATEHNSNYHMEGAVWTHTCMVYSYVKAYRPNCKVLLISAILHDLGKLTTQTITDGKTSFKGHEGASVMLATEVLPIFDLTDQEIKQILTVVSLHGVNVSQLRVPYLSMFRSADKHGRLSTKPITEYPERKFFNGITDGPSTVTILTGLPCSGKSTWASQQSQLILSRDQSMLDFAEEHNIEGTYSNVYQVIHSDDTLLSSFNRYFDQHISNVSKMNVDVIVDMTMLSLKDRRSMMSRFNNHSFESIVFLPRVKTIVARNKAREGKIIPEYVMENMIKKFVMPVKEEGFKSVTIKLESK